MTGTTLSAECNMMVRGKSMKKNSAGILPENGFEPFGDPFEQRHHEEEKRRSAPLLPNGDGMPPGSFAQSCHGCSVSTSPSGKVTLTCKQCIAPRGERIESSIEVGVCSEEEEITNQEGYLFCATKPSSCDGDLSTHIWKIKRRSKTSSTLI